MDPTKDVNTLNDTKSTKPGWNARVRKCQYHLPICFPHPIFLVHRSSHARPYITASEIFTITKRLNHTVVLRNLCSSMPYKCFILYFWKTLLCGVSRVTKSCSWAVSYTHLDVYKRQLLPFRLNVCLPTHGFNYQYNLAQRYSYRFG